MGANPQIIPKPPEGFQLDPMIPPEGFELDIPAPPQGFMLDSERKRGGASGYFGPEVLPKEIEMLKRSGMTTEQILQEVGGVERDPWIDPMTVGVGASGATAKMLTKAGMKLAPAAGRAALAGLVSGAGDIPVGTLAEKAGEKHPALAYPVSLGVGVLSGMTLEKALEKTITKGVSKAAGKLVKAPHPVETAFAKKEFGERFLKGELEKPKPTVTKLRKAAEIKAREKGYQAVQPREPGEVVYKKKLPEKPKTAPRIEEKAVKSKEPWEMTKEELRLKYEAETLPEIRTKGMYDTEAMSEHHKRIVTKALSENKPVPDKVLAEHPELRKAGPKKIKKLGDYEYYKQNGKWYYGKESVTPGEEVEVPNLIQALEAERELPGLKKPTPTEARGKKPADMTVEELQKETEYFENKIKAEKHRLDKLDPNRQRFAEAGIEHLSPEDASRMGEVTQELQRRTSISAEEAKKRVMIKRAARKAADKSTTLYGGLPIHKLGEQYTKYIGEPVWDKLVMKKIPKLLEQVPGGKAVNRAFLYDYRGNLPNTPGYIKSMEDMKRYQAVGREYAIDLGKRLQAVPEDAQLRMGEYIRGEIDTLTGKELELANEAKRSLYDLGKQSVDLGMLSEQTFFKNAGRYMPRLYTSKEYQSLLTKFNLTKPNRLDLSRFKKRKDIPKEIREQMGEILTPGYPVAKGITQLTHDIEMARWFNGIAANPEWALPKTSEATIPKGWKQLPSNKKLGALSEAYVHPEIRRDLEEAIHVMTQPEKVWRKALGAWKYGKVIISPKTHTRNCMSNSILAHLGGLPMYEQPVYLTKAAKNMLDKGKYWKAAKEEGIFRHTFTQYELRALFNQVEGELGGIKAQGIPEALGKIGKGWAMIKGGAHKAAALYEAEEQWFKLAKMIHNIERKGMGVQEAAKDAEKWLFNYAKVTKFQEKYRSKWYGAPFCTFTFKSLPRMAEAMVKTPWRFALPMSMIYGLEQAAQRKIGDTPEEIEAKKSLRPEWQKGEMLGMPNFVRVPIVDEYGREYYLNLTYILPWGDIGEGGGFGPIPGGVMPLSQPFVKEPQSIFMNYDPFWEEEIVKEKDIAGLKGVKGRSPQQIWEPWTEAGRKAWKIRGKHAVQSLAPTPVMDIAKGISTLSGKPDYKGRLRPPGVTAADVLAGVKMYPVDYVEQTAREIAKLHPQKGYLARKIKSDIRTLSVKKATMKKIGGNVALYDKQIKGKIDQLKGLAEEAREVASKKRKLRHKD